MDFFVNQYLLGKNSSVEHAELKRLHRPVKHWIKIARNQLGRRLMILKQLQTL